MDFHFSLVTWLSFYTLNINLMILIPISISRFFHMCYYISGGKRRPPLTQPVRYQSPDLGSSTEPSLTTRRRTSGTLTLRLGQRSRSLRKRRVVGIWSWRSWRSLNLMCVVEFYTIRGNGVLNTVHGTCHRVLAT